jgi:hypothetical protein
MTSEELTLIQNQIYTQLLLDEFKRQRKEGAIEPSDFLIDKYQIDMQTAERLKKILAENR